MSDIITTAVTRAQQLIAGTTKHFTGTNTLAFASASYTPQQLTQLLQSFVTAGAAVSTAKAAYRAKIAARDVVATSVVPVIEAYDAFVKATFTGSPDVLEDFGIAPKKVAKPSALTKAVAVDKRAATREARHTMGRNQKKAIKGTTPATPDAAPPIAAGSVVGASTSAAERNPSSGK